MVRLGFNFANLARYINGKRTLIGLEQRKRYISPENNAGIWHGTGTKNAFIEGHTGKKVKREWKPNVHTKSYYSELLDETITTTVTTTAMRQIDFKGGFDRYILHTSDKSLCSNFAVALKRRMETVDRMLQVGDKSLEEIKKEIAPWPDKRYNRIERDYGPERFYFDWKQRKHTTFC
jgi:ribosomal protein L28